MTMPCSSPTVVGARCEQSREVAEGYELWLAHCWKCSELDGGWSNLFKWKVFLLVGGSWNEMSFFRSLPHRLGILAVHF